MQISLGMSIPFRQTVPADTAVPALTQNVKVIHEGDSTTAGVGADPSGLTDVNGSRPFSPPLKAKDWLNANGVPAIAESVAADNNVTLAVWPSYRSDITVNGTLATSSRSPTVGGILSRGSTTADFTFTSSVEVDSIEFAFPRVSGFGTLQLDVDGVLHSTYNQSVVTEDYHLETVTGLTRGIHAFRFRRSAGTHHGPGYINAWDSTVKSVQIINAGARNWTANDWLVATTPSSPLNAIDQIDPDIAVIDIGINDGRVAGTTLAQSQARIQSRIDKHVANGAKIILVVPNDIQSWSVVTDAWDLSAVISMYTALQAANPGSVLVNAPHEYFAAGLVGVDPATWAALDTAGLMYDAFHPKAAVYAAEGDAVGRAIKDMCIAQGWLA